MAAPQRAQLRCPKMLLDGNAIGRHFVVSPAGAALAGPL
jgi:hypothetical protein